MKEHFKQKIVNDILHALSLIQVWKDKGEQIVFTNGCFDIIHRGHLEYLFEAKNLGTKLIVGLNDDHSVKRIKGEKRPINNLDERALLLSALEFVDLVIPFEQDTPKDLINYVLPDVLVKGGDYKLDDIVGSDIVIRNGGQVKTLQFIEGLSTSNTIETILNRYCNDKN